ncbi:hypothetical protein GWG54_17050 [Natronococcus sp. JC468]|uniref:hypothetical protein n=1 Tax=Natronococcus sp. JC468 TaxID=1961921 RepID=UPI00143C324F|nr:hypothetical protein [Natronococcus sp. JC468]NKE37484.1 hypothetical protein [Natronococcus sp. JC468]
MVDVTRRKAVIGVGGAILLAGCSDASGPNSSGDNSSEGNTEENDTDGNESENGAGGLNESEDEEGGNENRSSNESVEETETEPEAEENETTEADEETEEAAENGTTEEMTTEEFVTRLETAYSGEVVEYEEDETHGSLTLRAEEGNSTPSTSTMREIAVPYSAYVESGNAPSERLDVTIQSNDGSQELGTATVETEWVEQYNRGEISQGQLRERVLGTLET